MNRESGNIYGTVAFDDCAFRIHEDQIGSANLRKMHAKRIHPEMVGALRIARGDVPGHAFVETELGKQAEGGGEALLAVAAFLLWRCEFRNYGNLKDVCRRGTHKNTSCDSIKTNYSTGSAHRLYLIRFPPAGRGFSPGGGSIPRVFCTDGRRGKRCPCRRFVASDDRVSGR